MLVIMKALLSGYNIGLSNALHPPYTGFDNQQSTPASDEMFTLTILVTRVLWCVSTERKVTRVMPFLLEKCGECLHPQQIMQHNC